MKNFLLLLICLPTALFSQESSSFGIVNPKAPQALLDYSELIGLCSCRSVQRNSEGQWADTIDVVWQFKYILNGFAIQDETWKSDGSYTSSIRQYDTDSSRWVVTFFSSSNTPKNPPSWTGNRKDDKITLYTPRKAPNGTVGFSRLTFFDIEESGFNWIGEWVSKDESIQFPIWKIWCKKILD